MVQAQLSAPHYSMRYHADTDERGAKMERHRWTTADSVL
jgi:hypothetical protein